MFFRMTVFSLSIFHFFPTTCISSQCQSSTTIWTYYPCSFIISSSSSSFACEQASVALSIDQCTNQEITFFWHFPSGNMTITLISEKKQPFVLHLFKNLILKKKLIKNIYHLQSNITMEEHLLHKDDIDDEIIVLSSDAYHQCSVKFETLNQIIFDYGTFLQMTVLTTEN